MFGLCFGYSLESQLTTNTAVTFKTGSYFSFEGSNFSGSIFYVALQKVALKVDPSDPF